MQQAAAAISNSGSKQQQAAADSCKHVEQQHLSQSCPSACNFLGMKS